MMDQDRALFERAAGRFDPPIDAWEALLVRRDRKRRNQRIVAATVALLLAAVAIGGVIRVFQAAERQLPATPVITPRNVADLRVAWRAGVGGPAAGLSIRRAASPSAGAFPGPVVNAPTVAGDTVYVASQSGTLYAFPSSCGVEGATCRPRWFGDAGGSVSYPPTVSGGVVYVVTNAGALLVFPANCGSDGASCPVSWIGHLSGRPTSSPVVAGGLVYVLDHLHAELSAFPIGCATSGHRCAPLWVAKAGEPFARTGRTRPGAFVNEHSVYAPVVADGVVYVVGTTHQLYALDAATGKRLWVGATRYSNIGGTRFNQAVVSDGRVFVEAGTTLYAFRVGCGTGGEECRPLWRGETTDTLTMTQPVVANSVVYVGTATNATIGHLEAFPANCRTDGGVCIPLWVARADGETTTWLPVVAGDKVYVNSEIKTYTDAFPVSCSQRCTPSWRAALAPGDRGLSQLPLASGGLLFATNGSRVEAFDADCGANGATCTPLWTWNVPNGIASTPTIVGGELIVVTTAGEIYAFTPTTAS